MDIFKFEFFRIFNNRNSIIYLLILFVVALYFVNSGVSDYKDFISGESGFKKYEQDKISRFRTYSQYAGYGFRVLFEPSPLSIFFEKGKLRQFLESNVDVSENSRVIMHVKGKALTVDGKQMDFAGILFFFGSLYMLYCGVVNFRRDKFLKYIVLKENFLKSIFSRLVLLNLLFAIAFALGYFLALARGISFSALERNVFVSYSLFTLLFLTFFYMLGLFASVLFRERAAMISLLIWGILIIMLPEISRTVLNNKADEIPDFESVNIQKLDNLMEAERRIHEAVQQNKDPNKKTEDIWKPLTIQYLKEGYKVNRKIEASFNAGVLKTIHSVNRHSILLPSLYYSSFTKEISSTGFVGYADFLDYIVNLRDGFLNFYVTKRFIENSRTIEPFIKAEENIFKAQSRLPENYWVGLALTVFYSLVLLMVSLFVIRRRLCRVPVVEDRPDLEYLEGTSIFMMCKEEEYRDNVFEIFVRQENVAGLDRVDVKDIDSEIHPRKAVHCLASIKGVDKRTVLDNLRIMGVEEEGLDTPKPPAELLKKIYAALVMAEADIIVVNDFLKGETRAFEKDFLKLVAELKKQGKMFVYMSTEIFSATASAEERYYSVVEVYNYEAVDIENTSLR